MFAVRRLTLLGGGAGGRRAFAAANNPLAGALEALRGSKSERTLLVTEAKGTTFLKPLDVYSTPAMIWDMEWHVRDMVLAGLEELEGWDSVGTRVVFDHTAATVLGAEAYLVTEITDVDVERRRVTAITTFSDGLGELGRGTHERAIVKLSKVNERVAARKQELALAERTT